MGITEKYSKILLSLVALFDTQSYAYALLWLKKKKGMESEECLSHSRLWRPSPGSGILSHRDFVLKDFF